MSAPSKSNENISLQDISSDELLTRTKQLAHEERKVNLQILKCLQENSRRKLFLSMGYRSLFEYAVKELCYSEDAAYRRLQAMRLLQSVPEIEEKIKTGTITLSAAARLQNFFKAEEKLESAKENSRVNRSTFRPSDPMDLKNQPRAEDVKPRRPIISKEEKLNLINSSERKSTRCLERELVSLNPKFAGPEKIRPLDDERSELRIVISEELKQKLEHLKSLLSHKNPAMGYQELLGHLAEIALNKLDPSRRDVSGSPRKAAAKSLSQTRTRYIPAQTKRKIWIRDRGQCSFVSPDGRQCSSKHLLQYDHIMPFANSGKNTEHNLRLLCQQHNLWPPLKPSAQTPS